MIDHLTPFEGVIFGALITFGILAVASGTDSTQLVGGFLLAAGFFGGAITLFRSLMRKTPSAVYVITTLLAIILFAVKYIAFPSDTYSNDNYIWVLLSGFMAAGLIGLGLNLFIRSSDTGQQMPVLENIDTGFPMSESAEPFSEEILGESTIDTERAP